MTQPGAPSQPEDTEGDGTVGLEDRTEPDGQGSPDTNQGKVEPIPAADHEAAAAVPDLEDMNVGSADPQSPSHPAATAATAATGGGVGDAGGVDTTSDEGAEGSSESLAPDNAPGLRVDPDLPA